jgi:6-pyruvoyltetrahydropterin/6-carboxytetrahydropterin synthase
MIYVTRCYRFPAAHVLSQPNFSRERNHEIFGKCANPAGHGHDYQFEVSVGGSPSPDTGQIVAPALLDEIFEETVASRFSHRMLNDDEFFESLVPTSENILRLCYGLLADAVADRSDARLARLRIIETPRNFVEQGEIS